MNTLIYHFQSAATATRQDRRWGIEIETLFIDRQAKPISHAQSTAIMQGLLQLGWRVNETKGGEIVGITKDGFILIYDLGWNLFELITPTAPVDTLINCQAMLRELYQVAVGLGARPTFSHHDGHTTNTLMLPDKRDAIWLQLDGPALYGLGHIASIHYNIDLCGIEEGMDFIRRLNRFFRDQGWPQAETLRIWEWYLEKSQAHYEVGRYGFPPDNFYRYCSTLASYRVVMRRDAAGNLMLSSTPHRPFQEDPTADIEMFLRSVWWHSRLRVRGGRLVLEVRAVPRSNDQNIQTVWQCLRALLGI